MTRTVVRVIARHSRSKNGVASLAYGDEAIQPRAKRAIEKRGISGRFGAFCKRAYRRALGCFAALAMTVETSVTAAIPVSVPPSNSAR